MSNIQKLPNLLILVTLIIFVMVLSCKKENKNLLNEDIPINDYRDYEFEEPAVTGNTFYIDPVNGSSDGDGSALNPWRTLQEVYENNLIQFYRHTETYNSNSELEIVNENAPIKGGDRLILLTGYHGFLSVNNFIFDDWLTLESAENNTPVFSQIKLVGAFKNIYFKNLTIKKDSYEGPENYWEADAVNHNSDAGLYLASSDFWGKGSNVKINGLTIKTTEDISNWTAADWVEKSADGISLRSVENVEVVNCIIENTSLGIAVEYKSDHGKIVNNTVKNYSCDGARIISNYVLFEYNTIIGCFKVDENHDDAIQSYTRGEDNSPGTGVLYNCILRGNLIIGVSDPNNPLAGTPQGIGCFDGLFDGWIVENNVVITNHYHGITFSGVRNSKIINNTVVDQIPDDDLSPWIMITNHADETLSSNCIIANNIVSRIVSTEGYNVNEYNNYIIGHNNFLTNYELFEDFDNYDLHPDNNELTHDMIIDQGVAIDGLLSSEIDKDKNVRTLPPDIGAYEAK